MTQKRQLSGRELQQQRKKRRQWITFVRMCRYGVNNFSRNAWLTIAATAVMTITLLIIFMTFVAQRMLASTVDSISKTVDMSIYLKPSATQKEADPIMARIQQLSNTQKTDFISSEAARKKVIEANKGDKSFVDAIAEANNNLPATIRVTLHNINDTQQLVNFVKTDNDLKKVIDPVRKPSFAGKRKEAIQNIGTATMYAQNAGYAASFLFVIISSLIVFNTIRMAIFSRKEEISMMKLIGADRSFIRGPFVVEAIVYGFIAALIATGIGYFALFALQGTLETAGIVVQPILDFMITFLPFVMLVMIILGSLIGTISSFLATQRYLKIDKL